MVSFILFYQWSVLTVFVTEIRPPSRDSAKFQLVRLRSHFQQNTKTNIVLYIYSTWRNAPKPSKKFSLLTSTD